VSNDGITWATIGSASLSAGAYAGFAVTSHDTNTLHPSVFDNVLLIGNGTNRLPGESGTKRICWQPSPLLHG
jgi:hypothetical protein